MPLLNTRISPAETFANEKGTTAPRFPDGVVRLDYTSSRDNLSDWAMLWPQNQPYDWLIHMHGHGAHADQLYTRQDVRDLWLPAFRRTGLNLATLNLRDNAWMSPAAVHDLHEMLDYLRQAWGARRFIFITGSMSGTGGLIYSTLFPEDIAGMITFCSASDLATYHDWAQARRGQLAVLGEIADAITTNYGGPPAARPELYLTHSALKHAHRITMPLFLCHGDADPIIPVEESRNLVNALGQRSNWVYQEMAGGHHDSPLVMMPAALDWVLGRIGH